MSEPLTAGAVATVTVVTVVLGARGVRIARTPADFLVAARQVRPMLNASAISGEYLSAASFLGVAGLAMLEGLGALWYAVGYAAGYLILLTTVAAPLRRFGAYTIPDFAEGRLESPTLRRVSTAVVLVIAVFYLLPQFKGAGLTLQVTTGAPYWLGVTVLGAVVTANIASGGMKGITVVQAFQYWLKLTAIAAPVLIIATLAHHVSARALTGESALTFPRSTTVKVENAERLRLSHPAAVTSSGLVRRSSFHREAQYLIRSQSHSMPLSGTRPSCTSRATTHIRCSQPTGSSSRRSSAQSGCLTSSSASTPTVMAAPPVAQPLWSFCCSHPSTCSLAYSLRWAG